MRLHLKEATPFYWRRISYRRFPLHLPFVTVMLIRSSLYICMSIAIVIIIVGTIRIVTPIMALAPPTKIQNDLLKIKK